MSEDLSLYTGLVIVLGSATLIATAFHLLHLPPMVGFLFAGVVIGPNGLGLISSLGDVEHLAEIGSVLLLFTLGLEFSWRKVFLLRRLLLNLGLAQVLITAGAASVLAHFFWHLSWPNAVFSGLLVAMSSTAVILKLLQENRHMETPFGRSGLGILVSQDLSVILVLVLLPLMSQSTVQGWSFMTWTDLASLVSRGFLVVALIVLGTRYAVPRFLDQVSRVRSRELFFFAVLFVCVTIAWLMQNLGLSLSLGAFCAGVMVSESPFGRQTVADFVPFRDNFLAVFFVAIGMLLNLHFLKEHYMVVAGLLLGLIVLKSSIIMVITWLLGNSLSLGLATGLILSQVGEFSFILIDRGLHLGLIDESGRQLFLAVAIGSLALTPLLYRLALSSAYKYRFDEILPDSWQRWAQDVRARLKGIQVKVDELENEARVLLRDHVVLIGFGPTAQSLAVTMRELDLPYCVLESNQATVKKFQGTEPITLGDATHHEILEHVQLNHARLAVITITGAEIVASVLRAIRQSRTDLPVIIRTPYLYDLKKIGEDPATHFVVAEFEGALALIVEALSAYGVSQEEINDATAMARDHLVSQMEQSRSAAPP